MAKLIGRVLALCGFVALLGIAVPASAAEAQPAVRSYTVQAKDLGALGFPAQTISNGQKASGLQPITGTVHVTDVDYSQFTPSQLQATANLADRVYCTNKWNPPRCLNPLRGFVAVAPFCLRDGSLVGLFTFNPNEVNAPYDLYHVDSVTGTGFGESGEYSPGWHLFVARNIPPGTDDFWVGYDAQGLVFYEKRKVVLTCPSPPPPTWP